MRHKNKENYFFPGEGCKIFPMALFNFEEGEVLLVDKPLNWTSFDVVNKLRYAITKKIGKKIKIGHAGTLDPLATGLLVLCTGKKTREIEFYQAGEKEYEGTFYLGKTTPSYDAETEVNGEYPVAHIHPLLIQEAVQQLTGTLWQTPPQFSAIKVGGKKLYEQARKGREVQVEARKIEIRRFEILDIAMPLVHFRVSCSKGTYIRSLAQDFGKLLHSGAYLFALKRTKVGDLHLENALSVDQLVGIIRASDI